jgi:hypothetical protein
MRVRRRLAVRVAVVALGAVLAVAGCAGVEPSIAPSPPAAQPSTAAVGPAGEAARLALFDALGNASLIVDVSRLPFRAPEIEPLASAPRAVYQVTLPAETNRGFITVYEFPTEADAIAAAKAQHDYLASGPGRVQAPLGTEHVLRQLGSTVIYYSWLPAAAVDPSTPRVAEALRTIGTGFDIDS